MANPKKSASTKTETSTATTPAVAAAPVEQKASSSKKSKTETTAAAPAVEVATEAKATKKASSKKSETVASVASTTAAVETVAEASEEEVVKGGKKEVTRQYVDEAFSAIIAKIAEEIEKRAPSAPAVATEATADGQAPAASKKSKRKKDSGVPVKFLRSINKRLLALQADAARAMKLKKKTARNNENSGLMKPVHISEPLFKFLKATGFEVEKNQMYPRVEITRRIHTYVKDNNLRKENDKRVILPDSKLATLLNYDPKTAKEEMTYFRLPQYLKNHFISAEVKA